MKNNNFSYFFCNLKILFKSTYLKLVTWSEKSYYDISYSEKPEKDFYCYLWISFP